MKYGHGMAGIVARKRALIMNREALSSGSAEILGIVPEVHQFDSLHALGVPGRATFGVSSLQRSFPVFADFPDYAAGLAGAGGTGPADLQAQSAPVPATAARYRRRLPMAGPHAASRRAHQAD